MASRISLTTVCSSFSWKVGIPSGLRLAVCFRDVGPADWVRRVPCCLQISNQGGNQLEAGTVNGFPIHSGGHVARLRSDTLVGQEPQVEVVQFWEQLLERDRWLLGHGAKYRKQRVRFLH